MARNYAKEYANYQGKPEQITKTGERVKARRMMVSKTERTIETNRGGFVNAGLAQRSKGPAQVVQRGRNMGIRVDVAADAEIDINHD